MKTATKLLSGLLLASALLTGCSSSFHSTETTTVTDANGNTTVTTTSTTDGQTETSTYSSYTKDTKFTNDTDVTFEELNMKSSKSDEYTDLLDGDTLEPGYYYSFEDVEYNDTLKSLDFEVVDEDGNTYTLSGVDVSGMKDMDSVNFEFTQKGNTITVTLE